MKFCDDCIPFIDAIEDFIGGVKMNKYIVVFYDSPMDELMVEIIESDCMKNAMLTHSYSHTRDPYAAQCYSSGESLEEWKSTAINNDAKLEIIELSKNDAHCEGFK